MKKILKIAMLFMACMLIVGVTDVDAQYGKKKKKKKKKPKTETTDDYFDESGGKFTDKLWYGGGFNFQVSSFNDGFNQGTILLLGISPMVGYKINDIFSIGPRATANYYVFYQNGPNPKFLEWGIGAFGRAKVYNSIFAHAEYSFEAITQVSGVDQRLGDTRNVYIGGGYNSSAGMGGLGYEVLVLYNLTEENENIAPIEFRFGLTYNF
ncbi:MAG: hypothetical protein AB8F74_08950 [Saprospiraceae bacterium]